MGNCFVCFKEPRRPGSHSTNSQNLNADVPTVGDSAKRNLLQTCAIETSVWNGNHLQSSRNSAANETSRCSLKSHICSNNDPTIEDIAIISSVDKESVVFKNRNQSCLDDKLNALFDVYCDQKSELDEESDLILAEGTERLCKDLQLFPDEFRVLVFAWHLNASQMCRFSRAEFVVGFRSFNVLSISEVKLKLNDLVNKLEHDTGLYKHLYRFTFNFGLDVASGQRVLPIEMAVSLWRLVFTNNQPSILDRWIYFLELNKNVVRGIPKDTWNMFLNFSETVNESFEAYDDNEAWPSLFDDFVEYENDTTNQNVIKTKNEY